MSLSIALATVTLALRDMLSDALDRDPGWDLTGLPSTIAVQHFGSGGSGLVLSLIGVETVATAMQTRQLRGQVQTYELSFVVLAETDVALHSQLLIGAALNAISVTPVLRMPAAPRIGDDELEHALKLAADQVPSGIRLTAKPVAPGELAFVRLPALSIRAGPLSIAGAGERL